MENTILIHSPFLYNLFVCCGENYQEFVSEINAQIEMKIEELYEEVHDSINGKEIENSRRSVIPSRFRKFVEEKERRHSKKSPKYCMIEFYKHIARLDQDLMSSANEWDTVIQSDVDILEKFKNEFDIYRNKDAGAVNDKRLRDLFKKLKEWKRLNNDQEYLFDYLLKVIFPEYKNDLEESLLERIRFRPWEEVAFGSRDRQKIIKNILGEDDRYEQVHELFDKFNKLSSNDTNDIRKILIKISTLLDDIYEDIYDDNNVNQDESRNKPIEYDSIEEGRISELHSHIVAFMRWIPMISQDKPNVMLMESVDNVIDQIKVRAYEIIDNENRLKESLSTYPASCHDIIFMQDGGGELRRLLLNAMYHEPNICLQFKYFYGEDIFKAEKEGEINE